MKRGIINKPPIVGVLLLLKCELGPSSLIVCKNLYFLINLIAYFVEKVDTKTDKTYKINRLKLSMYIEFIKVIKEIINIKIL